MLAKAPNGRLHLALAGALVVASLIALVLPIGATQAKTQDSASSDHVTTAAKALFDALRSQAEGVTGVMARPEATGTPKKGGYAPSANPLLTSGLIPERFLAAAARLAASGALGRSEAQVAGLQRQRPVSFTLHINGFASSQTSSLFTVGDALAALGIHLGTDDAVSPPPDSDISPGLHVYIQYAANVRLVVGGQERILSTRATTVGGVLGQAGVAIQPADIISPPVTESVLDGMSINVTAVRDVPETVDEPIEFDTAYVYDQGLPEGERTVTQTGANGNVHSEYVAHQVNGQEAGRTLAAQSVTPPVEQIISVGTYVAPAPVAEPLPLPPAPVVGPDEALNCSQTMTVYATWYTTQSAGGTTTATGTGVYKGIVAVDPRVIPLGTQMYIPGYGYGLAADTGGGVLGNWIDLAYGDHDVYDWSSRWVDICILG